MILDFDPEKEQLFPQFKGGNGNFSANMNYDGLNRIMKGRLVCGSSIGLHTHETNSETIFVISGKGTVLYDGETFEISEGQAHYCRMGHSHSLMNNNADDLVFYAVVAEHDR